MPLFKSREDLERHHTVGWSGKTFFGGVLFLIGLLFGIVYSIARLHQIYNGNESTFDQLEITYSQEELDSMEVNLGKFDDSFNFITGLTYLPEDFDIFNNPYVEFIGYELTQNPNGGYLLDNKYQLGEMFAWHDYDGYTCWLSYRDVTVTLMFHGSLKIEYDKASNYEDFINHCLAMLATEPSP